MTEHKMAGSMAISQDEANLIRVLLSARNAPHQIKRGLQRLCGHLEKRRRLIESDDHRQLIRDLSLWHTDRLVRMYAFKALGLLGKPADAEAIAAALKREADFEAQTWGIAALVGVAGDRDVEQVFRDANLDTSLPVLLAGQLYANEKWTKQDHALLVPEGSDVITMKWAVLLVAYRRAPPNLFSPRHDNRVLLGELNKHDSREVAEHSAWALFEHPEYGPADYTIPLHEVSNLPPDVKKWAYRLLMTDPHQCGLDSDALQTLRRDPDVAAREGLALGLNGFDLPGSERVVLEWFDDERDDRVREILLEHMASSKVGAYAEMAAAEFDRAGVGSALRTRLLAAASGRPASQAMKRRLALEAVTDAGMARDLLGGDVVMGNQIKSGGDMTGNFNAGQQTAQNIVLGDMVASANGAVQNLANDRSDQREVLQKILDLLEREKGFPSGAPEAVATAVQAVAANPTPQNKMTLFGGLKALASGAGTIASVVKHVDELADAVMAAF